MENNLDDSFQTIFDEYRASIPIRVESLRILIDKMRTNPSESNLKEFRLQIHKLAGNAGIYGYEEVSKICKEFDLQLMNKIAQFAQMKNPEDWAPEDWAIEFDIYLEKIKKGFS